MEAEKLVLNLELERAKKDSRLQQYIDDIVHLSVDDGNGFGYVIKSICFDGVTNEVKPFYIEVKSTIGGISIPFYLLSNEKSSKGKNTLFIDCLKIVLGIGLLHY